MCAENRYRRGRRGTQRYAEAFLTPYGGIRIMTSPAFADVAELADAQVSEACDGDIVEVQVLSSAPKKSNRSYINI